MGNHTPSLYISPPKANKKHPFFVITQKKIKALFFVTSLKEKKASFKNLCHSIPKRFNLNTTVPLLRILPSHLYSTPYGTEKLELFFSTPISMFQTVPSKFFIVRSALFQLKLSMFQLPSPVTKLFFFLLALVK